jgi:hypothetical protein
VSRHVFVSLEVAVTDDYEGDDEAVAQAVFDLVLGSLDVLDVAGVESVDSFDYTPGAEAT